jgi:hypothetical protein
MGICVYCCRLRGAGGRLQGAGYRLQVCRLPVTGFREYKYRYRLQVAGRVSKEPDVQVSDTTDGEQS